MVAAPSKPARPDLDARIRRDAVAAARALFGESGTAGRDGLVDLVAAFAVATTPLCLALPSGRGTAGVLHVPFPENHDGGTFRGTVEGLFRDAGSAGPLVPVRCKTALDAGLPARLRLAGPPGPGRERSQGKMAGPLTHLGPAGPLDATALVGAVVDLFAGIHGPGAFEVRLPFACDVEEEPREEAGPTAWASWVLPSGEPGTLYLPHPSRAVLPAGKAEAYRTLGTSADAAWGTRQVVEAALSNVLSRLDARRREMHATALSAFRRGLDRQVLGTLDAGGSVDPVLYGWLSAGGDVRARLARRQAIESYPIVAALKDGPEPTASIDAGLPLVPALALALGCTVPVARSLAGMRERDGVHWQAVRTAPVLSDMPARNLPSPGGAEPLADQWLGVASTAFAWHALRLWDAPSGNAAGPWVAARMADEPPVWKRSGGPAACKGLDRRSGDTRDFVRAFVRALLLPLALDACPLPADGIVRHLGLAACRPLAGGVSPLDVALFRGRTLAEVDRMSTRWHGIYGAIEAALAVGSEPAAVRWPGLTRTFDAGDGVLALPLTDAAQTSDEGLALDHCVGTYALACVRGEAHLVSFRADGERLSTAEFRLGPSGVPTCVQHRGHGNADPPARAVAALDAYLRAIADGRLAVDAEAIAVSTRAGGTRGGEAALAVGYDFTDPDRRDLAVRLYGFALPSHARAMTHAEWAASLGLDAMMAEATAVEASEVRAHGHAGNPALREWGLLALRPASVVHGRTGMIPDPGTVDPTPTTKGTR